MHTHGNADQRKLVLTDIKVFILDHALLHTDPDDRVI